MFFCKLVIAKYLMWKMKFCTPIILWHKLLVYSQSMHHLKICVDQFSLWTNLNLILTRSGREKIN